MRYRDHKGGLDESMKTQIEINNVEDIRSHLNKFYGEFGQFVEEIKFEHCGMDARIGWDTYYVLVRLSGKREFHVAGMTDGIPGNTDPYVESQVA